VLQLGTKPLKPDGLSLSLREVSLGLGDVNLGNVPLSETLACQISRALADRDVTA
jgi:hypothetical protein